jgi:hypothetical protein
LPSLLKPPFELDLDLSAIDLVCLPGACSVRRAGAVRPL